MKNYYITFGPIRPIGITASDFVKVWARNMKEALDLFDQAYPRLDGRWSDFVFIYDQELWNVVYTKHYDGIVPVATIRAS